MYASIAVSMATGLMCVLNNFQPYPPLGGGGLRFICCGQVQYLCRKSSFGMPSWRPPILPPENLLSSCLLLTNEWRDPLHTPKKGKDGESVHRMRWSPCSQPRQSKHDSDGVCERTGGQSEGIEEKKH